jgi:hypothetical protein
MPTQRRDRSRSAEPVNDTTEPVATVDGLEDGESLRFRAATLDAAIALAEQALGTRVRVLAAHRIRRGGIAGFFASDLGVEVTVTLDDETIEQALERLVAQGASAPGDATRAADIAGIAGIAGIEDDDDDDDTVGSWTTPVDTFERTTAPGSAAPDASTGPDAAAARPTVGERARLAPSSVGERGAPSASMSPAMERMGQILDDLQALTETSPVASLTRRRAMAGPPAPMIAAAPRRSLPPMTRLEPFTSDVARRDLPSLDVVSRDVARATMVLAPATGSLAPSAEIAPIDENAVETVVRTADHLVETLRTKPGTDRVDVRVVVHLGRDRAVEAIASWSGGAEPNLTPGG